jgi:catalase
MRLDVNGEGGPNCWPASFGGPEPDPVSGEPPFEVSGNAARFAFSYPNDDFVQTGTLYRKVMTDVDRDHLVGNIVDHLGKAQKRIRLRQTALFFKADPDYGRRVAQGLALKLDEVERLAGVTREERAYATRGDGAAKAGRGA